MSTPECGEQIANLISNPPDDEALEPAPHIGLTATQTLGDVRHEAEAPRVVLIPESFEITSMFVKDQCFRLVDEHVSCIRDAEECIEVATSRQRRSRVECFIKTAEALERGPVKRHVRPCAE